MKRKKAKLSHELATKMYHGTDEQLRSFALENFPELGMKVTDRVNSYEDACKELGINPVVFGQDLSIDEIAYMKLKTIVKAFNEGWTPDWDNSNETKYYPWFKMSSSGVGFSSYVFVYARSVSAVGSRLVFKTKDLAITAGQKFTELYKQMLTL